jgi:hypothetical protein
MNRTFSKRCRASVALAFVAASIAAAAPRSAYAAPTEADMAQARELLREGLDLRTKGDAAGAVEKLKAAYALVRTPITAVELGNAYLAANKLVEAREAFLSVARIPVRDEETDRSRAARAQSDNQAEQLAARIPRVHIRVTGVPADSVAVTVDGAAIPSEALDAPRFVNPGPHVVTARSTTGATADTRVDLREGESREVELKIVLTGGTPPEGVPTSVAPALATHPAGTAPAPGTSRALEWSLIGVGAAVGIAGGVLLGVEAQRSQDAANQRNRDQYDSAKTLWTVGLGGAIAGGAAVVVGGVVFLTRRDPSTGAASSDRRVWVSAGFDQLEIGGTW